MSHGRAVNSAFSAYKVPRALVVRNGGSFMKTILFAFLSLCFVLSVVAFSQDPLNQAPQKQQAAQVQSTYILGTVSEQGEKLRLVTDQRAWNVDNPEILLGHEGHYVRVNAYVYSDGDSIHITEVKTPTTSESRENDKR
jgi:hypothetical protein